MPAIKTGKAWVCMAGLQAVIQLTAEEPEQLMRWSKSRTLPAGDVFKATLILALAQGKSYSRIEAEPAQVRKSGGIAYGSCLTY